MLKDRANKGWQSTMGFGKTQVFVTFGNNSFSGTVGWKACLRGSGEKERWKSGIDNMMSFFWEREQKNESVSREAPR